MNRRPLFFTVTSGAQRIRIVCLSYVVKANIDCWRRIYDLWWCEARPFDGEYEHVNAVVQLNLNS